MTHEWTWQAELEALRKENERLQSELAEALRQLDIALQDLAALKSQAQP